MKIFLSKYSSFLLKVLLSVFFLACSFWILLQTPWAQKKMIQWVCAKAQKEGISLSIESIGGLPPFRWSFKEVAISLPEDQHIRIKDLKVRIALLPLIRNQLSFSFISAEEIALQADFSSSHTPVFALPFAIQAKTLTIKHLLLEDLSSKAVLHSSLFGKVAISQDLHEVSLHLLIKELEKKSTLTIDLTASKEKNLLLGDVHCKLLDSRPLAHFFHLPLQTSFTASIKAQAPWTFLEELPLQKGTGSLVLSTKGSLQSLEISDYPFLNRLWAFESELSMTPDLALTIQKAKLTSGWLDVLIRCHLSPHLLPSSGVAAIVCSDLSPLSSLLSIPLAGSLEARMGLGASLMKAELFFPTLAVGTQTYTDASLKSEGHLQGGTWTGHLTATLPNAQLPWNGDLCFSLCYPLFSIRDLTLQLSPSILASASGEVNIEKETGRADFFLHADSLRPLRALVPSSDIDGKLGGKISLCKRNREGRWDVSCDLLLKNARYLYCLAGSSKLQADIEDLLYHPHGKCLLTFEDLLLQGARISHLSLASKPSTDKQSFSFEMEGHWKQPFYVSLEGLWEKSNQSWNIDLQACKGLILGKPLAITSPCSFIKQEDTFELTPLHSTFAEGSLSLQLIVKPDLAFIETKALHLPLDTISLLYPQFKFQGATSFQGSLQLQGNEVQGSLFAALEKADFSEEFFSKSMQAKGSLQVHLNNQGAQAQVHLYATEGQFLEGTATIPLSYHSHPLAICLDQHRPVSAEVTLQGKIEEIFHFMNKANHQIAGWTSGHLVLSNTLKEPFLQGSLELEQGSYENYFTGTLFQRMQGQLLASGQTLSLEHFEAHDEAAGILTAEGTLQVCPQDNFPFTLQSMLQHMHLVRSKAFDGTLSGPLLIQGDRQKALAQGALTIDKADIQIFDTLQDEIPSLHVTYINKPIHLQHAFDQKDSLYPLSIDIELSSDDTVVVKGKGLNSLWRGKVHLTGTPQDLTGKGSLTLKSGEFKFSGKTFILTQGEISFPESPSSPAHISLSGELPLSGMTVLANLQGPLVSPRLTFQSVPPLPTSSILSMILFNKDISEISALQAIQLAQVIVSLSGNGGPDVLEAIRKSLGVDRLTIAGKEGTNEIAVQIGWYLAHGITVSLSQSATSSDITIEVDLKNGLIFQAETQNQEEGKFSLKWNRNY